MTRSGRRQERTRPLLQQALAGALLLLAAACATPQQPPAGGMVAAAHPLAAEAGREILRQGGSAGDASIATQLWLGLV